MNVGGIVLCGGRSSRMGRPKAWLPFGDELMLPRVVRILREVVEPVPSRPLAPEPQHASCPLLRTTQPWVCPMATKLASSRVPLPTPLTRRGVLACCPLPLSPVVFAPKLESKSPAWITRVTS